MTITLSKTPPVRIGLDRCLADPPEGLRGARIGLLMNQASVDHNFQYASDLLAARFPGQLAAIFSPQHGLWCEQQANMIESPHGWYEPLGVPVYSLYSETRRPTADMIQGLDCLVIDLQDVGTRVYTFVWTVLECLRACAEASISVVLLDRPNPLGGQVVEGPLLEPAFTSFVGGACIPLRHGLTLGELAQVVNAELQINAALEVVTMDGWRRSMLHADTGRAWVAPSPNMPRVETTLLYPGQVLLEATNLSEGRGTTLPFEVVGAPYLAPQALLRELTLQEHPGVAFRPVRFVPTFDKLQGERCGGVALHIQQLHDVRSLRLTLGLLSAVARLYPQHFAWLPPPYEYEREKWPIDILYGSPRLREALAGSQAGFDLETFSSVDVADWWKRVKPHLLYE